MRRAKHSLSHYKLGTLNQGLLVPMGMFEVLPGDSVQQSTTMLLRVAPVVAPVMHPVHARIHHWFVPYRLLWEDWEEFITGGPDGMDASVFPTISLASAARGSLADYLGIPTDAYSGGNLSVSALPFRAYAKIFNEWYRDQDLVTPLALSIASGVDATTSQTLQSCAWQKDYFTSSRPWAQKGPAVTLPLGTTAPVIPASAGAAPVFQADGTGSGFQLTAPLANSPNVNFAGSANPGVLTWNNPNLLADLAGASAVEVTALREALALQRYEEARARYGSRYTEYLRYLGVRSSDARLQRPEYLGGGKQTIQWSEVLQTAEGTNPVGTMRGHGIGAMRSNRYRRFFEEHGLVMTLVSVQPVTMYTQGLARMWNRRTKEDFWQKELEHIGQQEVLRKELYAPDVTNGNNVFGYQDRYDEYRRQESGVCGEMRPSGTYVNWHQARVFGSNPTLNASFVQSNPTNRIYANTAGAQLIGMANHSIQARRLVAPSGQSFIY